jgi:hypothetical protein
MRVIRMCAQSRNSFGKPHGRNAVPPTNAAVLANRTTVGGGFFAGQIVCASCKRIVYGYGRDPAKNKLPHKAQKYTRRYAPSQGRVSTGGRCHRSAQALDRLRPSEVHLDSLPFQQGLARSDFQSSARGPVAQDRKFDNYTTFTNAPFATSISTVAPREVKLDDFIYRAALNYKFW